MRHCNTELGWRSLVGAEAYGVDWAATVKANGCRALEHGYTGLFCSDGEILKPENAATARRVFGELNEMWGA